MKLTDLFEMYDYQHPNIVWAGDIARFEINNQQYEATVRPARPEEQQTLQPFFDQYNHLKIGNIDFAAILPDGTRTQDVTGTVGSSAPKVIATVVQVVTALQTKHKYDILLAIAKRQHSPTNFESRVYVYYKTMEMFSKRLGLVDTELVKTPSQVVFAAFNSSLRDGMLTVQQHLQDYYNNTTT